ncbi:MAG: biotin/lipoyl-binding protein [Lachnospiraceae bacterium]|nr:biotin/lipoyl-binding protein [Lachnospiraceae bacterium]
MKYKVTLNNRTYEIEVEAGKAMLLDEYEAIAPAPRPASADAATMPETTAAPPVTATPGPAAVSGSGEIIEAPMPGTILTVNVTVGQSVQKGDVLLVLEAMKMENEISAPVSGTITQIVASRGATVETGSVLVVIG